MDNDNIAAYKILMAVFEMKSLKFSILAERPQKHFGMAILLIFFLAAIALVRPAACDHIMRISKKDNGKQITVSRGNTIELSLESQGSTGFIWEFTELERDCIEVVREETKGKPGGGITGAPVRHIWTLRPKKTGLCQLRMAYRRPWEGKDKAIDLFSVRLKIVP